MKKQTTLLLTLLMVFTLIGCNSKKEEPTNVVNEPVVEKQEEEVKQEEPVIVEEPKEEKEETTEVKEEVETIDVVDPSIYDYWVVVYDQYGNELSRTTAHYGTIVKDPDENDVKVLTNTYFHSIVNYSSSKKDSGSTPTPAPVTNYTVTFELDQDLGSPVGKVLDSEGTIKNELTVPSGTTFASSGNTITIGENTYTAEANSGWTFSSFDPESGTITSATTIKVNFAQNQP